MGKELLRLISESSQAWESLNFIDGSGEATQKLLAIFPKETLLKILRLYRIIKGFDEEVPRYKYLSDTFPVKDFQRIKGILERHQGKWIGKEDIEDCISYIQERFERSQKGIKALRARAKEERIKRLKITKPTDEPLIIAVYLLVSHMKAKTKKANWKLICDFFQEQKIINRDDVHSAEYELRNRYRKTTEARVKNLYESYRGIYTYPMQSKEKEFFHPIIHKVFPEWSKLMP